MAIRGNLCFLTNIQSLQAFCRLTEYSIQLWKHSDGRQDALCWRSKYSDARQSTLSKRGSILTAVMMLYPSEVWPILAKNGHSSNGASTMSPVTMLYLTGASTLSRDRVRYLIAEILSRPTRCFIPQKQELCRPSEYRRESRKHHVGRQSAKCDKSKLDEIIKWIIEYAQVLLSKSSQPVLLDSFFLPNTPKKSPISPHFPLNNHPFSKL